VKGPSGYRNGYFSAATSPDSVQAGHPIGLHSGSDDLYCCTHQPQLFGFSFVLRPTADRADVLAASWASGMCVGAHRGGLPAVTRERSGARDPAGEAIGNLQPAGPRLRPLRRAMAARLLRGRLRVRRYRLPRYRIARRCQFLAMWCPPSALPRYRASQPVLDPAASDRVVAGG
jgi:hypothetical protein